MLSNWCESQALRELFNRMTSHNDYEWQFMDAGGSRRRIRIVSDDDEPDYWVVMNRPAPADERAIDPARTVVFPMEPLMWTEPMRPLWGHWASPSPLPFLQVRDHRRYRNSNDWWLGLSYEELSTGDPQAKSRLMAACVSGKYFDPGHRKRLDFLHFLDGQDLDLDIFGYEGNGFRAWRGATPLHDKRSCLLPYRYYFDAENNATPNYYTEKIVDCLLAETLCFYWGCPNLDSFFDPRSFIRLDLDDFDADFARIRAAIDADEWATRLPFIQAEKRRILEDYQFFPTLAKVLDPARRQRHWHVGQTDRQVVEQWIGRRRAGTFVEISARTGAPEISETLDVERRLDWSGLCLEANEDRVRAARTLRDCTVAVDPAEGPIDAILVRNALAPGAIDWLNLAVASPYELLEPGGRLDPSRVRANLITMPTAGGDQRRRCREYLSGFGYDVAAADGAKWSDSVMVRRGRDDIYGLYHLCTINTWRDVLGEQVDGWMRSGLLEATNRVFISLVGPEIDEAQALLGYALGSRAEFIQCSEDATSFERPLLMFGRRFCERGEPLARAVWYMHAKGISSQHCHNPHVTDWRRFMEHFVVERWRDCVDALIDHDASGVNWHLEPAPHFSGNFWWATPRYVATLPASIGAGHFEPEGWIGANQPRVRCFQESGVDHYVHPYPSQRYRETQAVASIG